MNIQLSGLDSRVSRQTVGWLAVLVSAFFFYLVTLLIRWVFPYVTIESAYFVFARLLLGFTVVSLTILGWCAPHFFSQCSVCFEKKASWCSLLNKRCAILN